MLSDFLSKHKLPESYQDTALKYFKPLASEIALHQKRANRPILLGINGCQGSGKSTLTDFLLLLLSSEHNLNCIGMSIDDFYYSKAKRDELSKHIHPLLAVRGVPGTHDTHFLKQTIASLKAGIHSTIPKFDKSCDDLYSMDKWTQYTKSADIIILEGWCVGIPAQTEKQLIEPVNQLESQEDCDGKWRKFVNDSLKSDYEPIFGEIDLLLMLKAPSFESVFNWRKEQEHKLIAQLERENLDSSMTMNDEQIERFISFYQRLTEHALTTLPNTADYVLSLDEKRQII